MYIKAETLDDLMNSVFEVLINLPFDISTTRGVSSGNSSELIGVLLELENPRARLSRTETKGTLFSAIGETLWYLSKSNKLDFIQYYIKRYKEESEDGETVYGGYGPRLFNNNNKYNQVTNVIELLKKKPTSRRAAIQLFNAEDINDTHKEIPCTCTLQFILRNNLLHMVTYMRSNDAYWGLPHDVFAFTMLQEIVASSLGVELGSYKHSVGSLHLYEKMKKPVEQYLKEGFQTTKKIMPSMPLGDPQINIDLVLELEEKIRNKKGFDVDKKQLDPYWQDIVILLQIYSSLKDKNRQEIISLKDELSNIVYKVFIDKKLISLNQLSENNA